MKFTREQALEALKKLSQQERERVTSLEVTNATKLVAEKNEISKEKLLPFSYIIGTVLLGLIPKEKLAEQLSAELQLPPEKARAIAAEVEKEIFANTPRTSTQTSLQSSQHPLTPTLSPLGKGREGESTSPNLPFSKGEVPSPRGGGVVLVQEEQKQMPIPPRPVPIRKEIPPPIKNPPPSLQSLLADIRRGTAYDEGRVGEAFRKTPIEVKQSLESVGFLSRLQGVSKKFGLNVEETGELVSETGLVMLGLTEPMQFVDNLVRRLRLPRDRAMAVGQAVNMEILRPVREILRKMSNTNIPMNTNLQMSTNKTEEGLRFAPPVDPYREPIG